MNIEVIEQGPEISMPGLRRSAGTGGTFQSPVVAGPRGGWVGSAPWVTARRTASARWDSTVRIGAPSRSCSASK